MNERDLCVRYSSQQWRQSPVIAQSIITKYYYKESLRFAIRGWRELRVPIELIKKSTYIFVRNIVAKSRNCWRLCDRYDRDTGNFQVAFN